MKRIVTHLLFVFLPFLSNATFYQVTGTGSGISVGNNTLSVTALNGASVFGPFCGTGPYFVGNPAAFQFSLSIPVNAIRLHIAAVDSGEVLSATINGTAYSFTASNLSSFAGSCACKNVIIAVGGVVTNPIDSPNGGATINIVYPNISNFTITHSGLNGNGTVFDFYFSDSCMGNVAALHDSACLGRPMQLYGQTAGLSASTTFSWTGPNGFSSTSQNPIISNITSAAGGWYHVTATNVCPHTDSVYVNVHATPFITSISNNGPKCVGDSLNLYSASSPLGSFSWTGPHSFSSNSQNPLRYSLSLIDSGYYRVTATIAGCSATDSTRVVVKPMPAFLGVGSNSAICEGDTLKLTAASSAGVTYAWSGPNSFTGTTANATILNAQSYYSGYYTATATLNGCSLVATTYVNVYTHPTITSISNSSPLCEGSTLFLSSASNTNATYSWTGPNGFSPSSSLNPNTTRGTIQLSDSGYYKVTVILNNCSTTDSTHVIVKPLPTFVTASVSKNPYCVGDTINLSVTSTAGTTFSWSGPNSFSSTSQNPTILNAQFNHAGVYTAISSLNGCTISDTALVVVNSYPSLASIGNNGPMCKGATLNLSASSAAGVTYVWMGPNSFYSGLQNPNKTNVQLVDSGNYYLTVTLNGCSTSGTTHVSIKPLPASPAASSNSPVCTYDVLTLTANGTAGATYLWSGPGPYSSTSQNPVISSFTTSAAGTYKVVVTLNGCSDSSTTNVSVNQGMATPTINIVVSDDTLCIGHTVTFTATIGNSVSPAYQWIRNGLYIPAATSSTYTTGVLSDFDYISCRVKSFSPCQPTDSAISNIKQMRVITNAPPQVSISSIPPTFKPGIQVTFTAIVVNGGVGLSYQWRNNGIDIPGANSSSYTVFPLKGDKITLWIKSIVPCTDPDTAVSNELAPLKTGNIEKCSSCNFGIYPNPNNGNFTISGILEQGNSVKMEITNLLGQVVYHNDLIVQNKLLKEQLNLNIPSGIYLLHLQTEIGREVIRFTVK